MNQIFIKVKNADGVSYDKDIRETTDKEQETFYNTLSKGQVVSLFKQAINKEMLKQEEDKYEC